MADYISGCCGGTPKDTTEHGYSGEIRKTDSRITFLDRLGWLRVRIGIGRNRFRADPGLYALVVYGPGHYRPMEYRDRRPSLGVHLLLPVSPGGQQLPGPEFYRGYHVHVIIRGRKGNELCRAGHHHPGFKRRRDPGHRILCIGAYENEVSV